jgi:hypothetical protein
LFTNTFGLGHIRILSQPLKLRFNRGPKAQLKLNQRRNYHKPSLLGGLKAPQIYDFTNASELMALQLLLHGDLR